MGKRRVDGFEIAGNPGRELQVKTPSRRSFTLAKQKRWLQHFASTCNVTLACEAAGVNKSTVYKRRTADPQFREAWATAQEQGYAALEAELVRRGLEFLSDVGPNDGAADRLAGMDVRAILAILQQNAKTLGREPGDVMPRRSDIAEATKRLEKAMARLRLLDGETESDRATGE